MSLSNDDISENEFLITARTKKFSKLYCKLEGCREDEQMQKIQEMDKLLEKMNKEEFESVFKADLFNKIDKMIDEKKLTMKNAIKLLKQMGYCKTLKKAWTYEFRISLLNKRFEKMIICENLKKDVKNEDLLANLCECYLLLRNLHSEELIPICVSCLMKVASKKEEGEETQKEVEMALLALSNLRFIKIEQELYLNEIKEIILNYQEHYNLTHLAYQSAWQFLIRRFGKDRSLEDDIVNELHFINEASVELEKHLKCFDWKSKEEKERGKEAKELLIIEGWTSAICEVFSLCELWNEELVGLLESIIRVCLASKDNYRDISEMCIYSLIKGAGKRNMEIDTFVKKGAIDIFLEEMKQSTLLNEEILNFFHFFLIISKRMKKKEVFENDEAKRKATKMEIFEKMEEEGFEDIVASFIGVISILCERYDKAPIKVDDCFVNV
ncbi:uncharacterized protein MONOS_18526 [Monocercomonoides exilis]|uniref:uncharacterized protein n=1 Tax=Monocercomonoides exilis TaxID=2049356 RepID=UPI003559C0A4|nr:hypothetical protein MONOS_18526 [Monocercomonoides exilis]